MKNRTNDGPCIQPASQPFGATDYTSEATYRTSRFPVEAAVTLIPEAYTSAEFFTIEQERVFGNSWIAVGCTSQVQKPRDVLVVSVGGQSIIVSRNKNGELKAFYNVCRHRGTKMLEEDCRKLNSSLIRCPYHSWTYDLDGACTNTPMFENKDQSKHPKNIFEQIDAEPFDRKNYGLFPVKVASWGFLIFINLNENAEPLEKQLGDLPHRFANYCLEEWKIVREKEFVFNANYKLVGENFMECYHLPWIHPELIKVSRVEDHYRWQGTGMYTGMTTKPISSNTKTGGWMGLPPVHGLQGSNQNSGRFVWIFPNIAISVLPNHCFVMLTQPKSPSYTIEQTWLLCHPESLNSEQAEAELDQLTEFWSLVNNQDISIVEKVQAGVSMKPYRGGRMCFHFEEPLHRFQNMIIDKMTGIERIPEGDTEETR
ncbi:MAG: aromatic ring-hydroxylating dioxygenase subunit alpha [SAR324 cluster bacterium]|nr:aromatic ring-hydroxylating dioxygenase subunit alpha [SAR324 cluster bacterium]